MLSVILDTVVPANLTPREWLTVDVTRDSLEVLLAQDPCGTREYERTSTQRSRYFSSYELAVQQAAIETGVLPLTDAIYQRGGYPQFSCEGHPELTRERRNIRSYVCFWAPPENEAFWDQLPASLPESSLVKWSWSKMCSEHEATLMSPFTGTAGAFYSIHLELRKHTLKVTPQLSVQAIKDAFSAIHANLAGGILSSRSM
jgi:hypothetical protein